MSSAGRNPFGRKAPTPPPPRPSIARLVDSVVDEGRKMIVAQVELLKQQAQSTAKRGAGAIGAFVAAALFGLALFWWTFHTVEVAIAVALPEWAAALIVWGLLVVLAAVSALVGKKQLDKAKEAAPDPKLMVEQDVEAVKEGLGK